MKRRKTIRAGRLVWDIAYTVPRPNATPQELAREPFCRDCARRGLRVYATDVDHVVPHDGDWSKFVDPENMQSLCHSCHSAKTIAESRAKAARRKR
ncbi:HNH endonuclease signature motif containing protein [Candidatus Agathobaculum pullicola]|uniref:HNH endonuclease signature motif containing protein n=1 Tax=Candidatus Agathobaculum pullicola TaxID=2838426 RepID=UPI003F914E48